MLTTVHMDGGRLSLTHYCVAQNQPRMAAVAFPAANEVRFEFVGGGSIPHRDVGHMDKAHFRFVGPDAYSSRWTSRPSCPVRI